MSAALPLAIYQAAAQGGCQKIDRWLRRKGAHIDARCLEAAGSCLLHAAAVAGQVAMVLELIRRRASVDVQNDEGGTALMEACMAGHQQIVLDLLEAAASLEVHSFRGGTALLCAASSGHTGIVRELLSRGARVDARDSINGTALMHAASQGHGDVLSLLLAHCHTTLSGNFVDHRDELGESALTCAVAGGHEECVRRILHAGADALIEAGGELTALQLAVVLPARYTSCGCVHGMHMRTVDMRLCLYCASSKASFECATGGSGLLISRRRSSSQCSLSHGLQSRCRDFDHARCVGTPRQ